MSSRATPSASASPRTLPPPPRPPQPSLTSLFASHLSHLPSTTQHPPVTLSSNPFPTSFPHPPPAFTSASDLLHFASRTGTHGTVRASGTPHPHQPSSSSSPSPDEARVHDLSDEAPDVGGVDAASHATSTSSASALSTSSSAASLSSLSSLLHALSNMSAFDLQSSGILPSPAAPPTAASAPTAPTSGPPPPQQGQRPSTAAAGLRELGDEAVWTLSSSKVGNGVAQLRDGRADTFWQSDGLSPHYISIHFARKTRVQLLSFYVDHKLDESYTPARVVVRGGSHSHGMRELCSLELEEPTGWITVQTLVPRQLRTADAETRRKPKPAASSAQPSAAAQLTPAAFFSPSHPSAKLPFARPLASASAQSTAASAAVSYVPLRCHYLQLVVLSSHQSGKDTHVREVKVYGPVSAGQEGLLQRGRGEGKENARTSHPVALLHPVFSSIEFQSTSVLR